MSSLARYLSPTSDARPNPGYVVEWRHAEGGPWLAMANAASLEDAVSELASPTVALTMGDLARVLDPRGAVAGFSVQTDERLVALPSCNALKEWMLNIEMGDWCRICGHDWERAWEGCVRSDWLLHLAACAEVDRRLLVLTAHACAEPVLRYVPAGEDRPRVALETARRWARGEATFEEVRVACNAAWDAAAAAGARGDRNARAAANAAWSVADLPRSTTYAWACASERWDDLTETPALVRRHIPLYRLALAVALNPPA